jgi:uncharacterized OB-fold protein
VSAQSTGALSGDSFVAPLEVAYPYKRTVGTTLSRFFNSMIEGRLEGTRGSDGKVYCPPAEFDPITEWVSVAETGTVSAWAWQATPQPDQPLARPFAWALVLLDGTDVPMLHAVDAGSIERIRTGARVKVRWAEQRSGGITDIACFDLLEGAGA